MKSNSFPKFARLKIPFFVVAGLLACAALQGQDFSAPQEVVPPPVEEVPAANPKLAHVRTWFMARPAQPVDVVLTAGSAPEDVLVSKPPAYFYCGYREAQPGSVRLQVYPRGSRERPLASREARLEARRFYTVLIRPGSGGSGYELELLDDTLSETPAPSESATPPSAPPAARHRIILYQFIEDRAVDLDIPALEFSGQLPPGDTRSLEAPSALPVVIRFKFQDDAGKEVVGETDANLQEIPSLSVLIIRDLYGRFSPRLVANGILD